MEKMNGGSMDLVGKSIRGLKQLFPEAFTEDKVDFERLKLLLGANVDEREERYELRWNGKTSAIKLAQTPTMGTLRPNIDISKNWDTTENLYIEGDNLEVLKLLQKSYFGKIKMIYIDPPYNTGNDFVYKDDFKDNIKNYKEVTGQSTKANMESNGRYHTDWLNMIYPRLKLSRNLLSDDGVIFISIGNEEVENVKRICNEIFGEENFRNSIIIRRGAKNLQSQFESIDSLNSGYEYVLMYSKFSDERFEKVYKETDEAPIGAWNNHWRGTDRPTMRYELFGIKPNKGQWRWAEERSKVAIGNYKTLLKDLNIDSPTQEQIDTWYLDKSKNNKMKIDLLRLSKNGKPEHYIAPSNKRLLNDLWDDLKPNGSSYTTKLFGEKVFDNPKSIDLIIRLLEFVTYENSIILDFFSGSSSTAHGVMQLNAKDGGNRKFIMIQLPELTDEKSDAYKSGYKNICDIGKERIRRAGEKIKEENKDKEGIEELDTGFKVFKLDDSNIKTWNPDYNELEQDLLDMQDSIKEGRTNEDLLFEIILKMGFELTTPIEEVKVGDKVIYNISEGALIICLEGSITEDILNKIPGLKSEFMRSDEVKVIFKEKGFRNDKDKMNAIQNLKQQGITNVRSV